LDCSNVDQDLSPQGSEVERQTEEAQKKREGQGLFKPRPRREHPRGGPAGAVSDQEPACLTVRWYLAMMPRRKGIEGKTYESKVSSLRRDASATNGPNRPV
jgi:hypothetical protein